MKDVGIVLGDKPQAQPLIVNNNNVYIHTDIKQREDGLYEYHEHQMPLDEFLMKLVAQLESVDLKAIVAQGVTK